MLDKYNQIMKERKDAGIVEEVPISSIRTAGKT